MYEDEINDISTFIINLIDTKNIKDKDCIIFDIDGTLIDHNQCLIIPIVNILFHAYNMGINIILITSRQADERGIKYTKEQLALLNIPYKRMYMKKYIYDNDHDYKRKCRIDVKKNGYNALMAIGDNHWDVFDWPGRDISEYVKHPFLLPKKV